MSQENVESFKQGMEAWNRDDFDAWIDRFDPEVEWFALMEVFRGHAGAQRAWESFKVDMQLTVRFDEIRDLGESVLALGEMDTTGRTTHLDFTGEIAQLVIYRGGKVISSRDFRSHAEALRAVGLSK
jgi:ketosteroid isomerase-like protein